MSSHTAFFLDSSTGIIYVKAALNYESTTSYTLTVTAWDRASTPNSADATVTITVTDENDNAPDCAPRLFKKTAREDVAGGTTMATLACTDDDSGLAGTLAYAIASVNGNPGSGTFAVDSSGVVTATSLDYETDVSNAIIVNAYDTSASPLTTTVLVIVTVTDVNEYDPVFSGQPSTLTISESVAAGTSVTTIVATDQDSYESLSYSFNPSDSYFTIDPATGEISTMVPLDRETLASHSLTIEALDSGTVDSAKSASHSLTITVSDVNDETPVFSPAVYYGSVSENDAVSTTVLTLTASDGDSGTDGQVSYSIVSGNADAIFRVDLITPARTGELVIDSVTNLDYETTTHYDLVVEAVDGGGLSSSAAISVEIEPYNEDTPLFTPSSTYTVSVLENTAPNTLLETVAVTDTDSGFDGQVVFAITSGGSSFDIDPDTGNVSLVSSLDRETSQYHTLTITATDAGVTPGVLSATATLSLTVLDYNDKTPVCSPSSYSVSLAEDASTGDAVATPTCSDADSESPSNDFTFALVAGTGSTYFDIDTNTGAITVSSSSAFDYETATSYTLTARVTDGGTPALSSDASVTVQMTGK